MNAKFRTQIALQMKEAENLPVALAIDPKEECDTQAKKAARKPFVSTLPVIPL